MLKLNKDKAKIIASHYVKNGFVKSQALRDAGTQVSKASLKLFDREPLKSEVDRRVEKIALATEDIETAEIIRGLKSVAFAPKGSSVRDADRTQALIQLAKITNLFDSGIAQKEQRVLNEREKIEAKLIASILLSPEYERRRAELLREVEIKDDTVEAGADDAD